ncbi:MAG: phosphate ABC transporter permease subunit PstC, partial [Acholeplasmataceae bacterium]|nr:phosphate ABC transporter permease subunit PstC [Acholeplasmataceae bacterium]
MKKNSSKIQKTDFIVHQFLKGLAILSASFIFVVAGVILIKGLTPFITNNNGIGSVNAWKFLTGDTWLIGETFASNLYSVGFIIVQTLYVVLLSLLISFPVGVLTALFIAKIAPKKLAEGLRTVIEILASIPSIIYGLFGAGLVLQVVYDFSGLLGYQSKGG